MQRCRNQKQQNLSYDKKIYSDEISFLILLNEVSVIPNYKEIFFNSFDIEITRFKINPYICIAGVDT